jgi:hypothetical protein
MYHLFYIQHFCILSTQYFTCVFCINTGINYDCLLNVLNKVTFVIEIHYSFLRYKLNF